MYSFTARQEIAARPEAVWAVWTDPDRFPDWDPREERTRLHGPFAEGSTIESKQKGNPGGTATITTVETGTRWTLTSPLPGGELVIDHLLEPAAGGGTVVTKRYDVTGPLALLFRAWYGPRVRHALPATFAALDAEAWRRG
ncbi:MAG: SRPBCC family protein [Kitasatospora sp.]|jgi:uncharacterized protein YndB with AHSA1/START domain|nr:SRPBCC family protein [Kitasatospora sp.]